MAAKNTRTIERSDIRHIPFVPEGEVSHSERPKLIGKARAVPARESDATEATETDVLLHHMHDLVAQLREAVGRPRLDL